MLLTEIGFFCMYACIQTSGGCNILEYNFILTVMNINDRVDLYRVQMHKLDLGEWVDLFDLAFHSLYEKPDVCQEKVILETPF